MRGPNVNSQGRPSATADHPPTRDAPRRPPITLRRFIRLERGILTFTPRHPRPPEKPARADEVLDALAVAHQPGDRVGLEQITAAGGISHGIASAIRKWARWEHRWPYRDRLSGFAALADRDRKGGEAP